MARNSFAALPRDVLRWWQLSPGAEINRVAFECGYGNFSLVELQFLIEPFNVAVGNFFPE